MYLSTIVSWGTAEDRPEREAMRALLIGRSFMAAYRAARGGQLDHRFGWWCEWVRDKTVTELRWMWRSERAYKDEHLDAYAQVAGDLIIKAVAAKEVASDEWFRTDISELYGWLFEPACLEYDGWKQVEVPLKNGNTIKTWTKRTPPGRFRQS